jgi:hypothetical protein
VLIAGAGFSIALSVIPLASQSNDQSSPGHVRKSGIDLDVRSAGRQIADRIAESGVAVLEDEFGPVPGVDVVPQVQLRGANVQVNDAALDNVQVFPGFRPFIKFTQSETSIAAFGRNIVAGYNSSANQPLIPNPAGPGLVFLRRFFSGFSTSNDGGQTWTSGFVPPVPGSIFTFGDPVVAADRHGNFYYSGLGADALGRFTIQVNKSTDGGRTWGGAVVVQQDNGGDKEWLAVGPDPSNKSRDNVYVTWTSFQATGAQLRFGRSTDGGATWASKTIFAPPADPNPDNPQNALQFSNTYVDPISGVLYVPFLHFSNSDADFIRILISEDAGETFSFATFNAPGAPNPTTLPVVQPGTLIDCGSPGGGVRLAIHTGPNVGGGRAGLPRYVRASRVLIQPAFAARNRVLYMAWTNSTSPVFGDLLGAANILFTRSDDGGQTWTTPIQVNPPVPVNFRHVLPALSLDNDPNDVHVAYYTQHADGTVDVDLANSHDRGDSFPADRTVRVTAVPSTLAPTNIPIPTPTAPFATTNYDRLIAPCYSLGEYLSTSSDNGSVHVLWGDLRNTVTHPVNALDPLSGQTHSQQDVVYQKVKAQ